MDQYTVKSTSKATAEILEDFIIDETQTTRRIFKATIVENLKDPSASVSGSIIHQRKGKNDSWEEVSEMKLSQLKSGEGVKFIFSCGELKEFYDILNRAYAIGNRGVSYGTKELVVGDADKLIEVPAERNQLIKDLISKNFGEDVWTEILSSDPDLATRLSYAKVQSDRIQVLTEFESNLNAGLDEGYWQDFFFRNTWIFGYGLSYQFLHLLEEQPHYGGQSRTGKGDQRGDFLTHTGANNSFTVLVEIKKPNASLFSRRGGSGEIINYRNGAPLISGEIAGAISQIQVNCHTWQIEGSQRPADQEALTKEAIYTHQPRGILVIGNTSELDDYVKRNAFELFRRNMQNPEIITFDELYERAKFIVSNAII